MPDASMVVRMCDNCRVESVMNEGSILTKRRAVPLHGRRRITCGSATQRQTNRLSLVARVSACKKRISAARSSGSLIVCSGILVPGVYMPGPSSKSFDTVSGVQTISIRRKAGE